MATNSPPLPRPLEHTFTPETCPTPPSIRFLPLNPTTEARLTLMTVFHRKEPHLTFFFLSFLDPHFFPTGQRHNDIYFSPSRYSVNIEAGTPPSYSGSVGGTNEQGGQTLGRELSNSSSTINPPGSPYSNRSTASQPTVYTNFYARSGTSSSSSDQTSSLIDHGFSSFDQFDEIRAQVQNFLQEESLASKVRVLTAKVCQKSYRGEKRWLTPPPLVEISGEHWPTGYCENITVDASYFTTDEEGLRSYLSNSSVSSDGGSSRGNSRAQRTKEQLDDKNNACFKQLYIGEMGGKINQLTIDFSLNQESSGIEIGQFASKPIRVIPKPTKTSKKVDLSITSGSKVALFIRLRSQTVDNRYLKMNDSGMLSLETNTWSAFTIKGNGIREGSDLKYGDEVVLTASNGATTNPMRIMRMDKGRVDFDSQDQICHLQHVAMQLTSNNLFLATSNHSNLSMFNIDEGDVSAVDNNFEWTIVGTNEMTYTFYEGDSPSAMSYPVSAVPIVERIQLHSDRKKLSLHGYDMNDSLSLWFGDTNVPTEFRCEELIVCTVPTMEQLVGDCEVAHVPAYCKVRIEVPLILVRPDGLLYPTGQSFIYDAVPLQVYEKFAKKGLMRRVQ
eukprot:TRINITY_DN448_c0_g1_i10.p1 TRINITY_DN448_c0_g1~~TRINITY_DN448_c0_g1_i10.p1  ORF type:complete len:614 (-),score=153.07 TRINITY_DN448_c0_g1_i10:328-2169(-)